MDNKILELYKKEFAKWLEDRPEVIKELAEKVPMCHKYRLKKTGQHCSIYSYFENGTLSVIVDGHDSENLAAIYYMMPIRVFGLPPEDLEVIE